MEIFKTYSKIDGTVDQGYPEVSWIMGVHQVNDAVRIAIQSCLNQTFNDFELLIIVNGQNSFNVAKTLSDWFDFDQRISIYRTNTYFLTFSLSLGIHLARGKYIARMDADDVSRPDRLSKQVSFMKKNPDVDVLGGAFEIKDATGKVVETRYPPESDRAIKRALIFRNPMCHPTIIFKRDPVEKVGAYLGGLYAEDYELWVRLNNELNAKFANLPDILLAYNHLGGEARGARSAYASQAATQLMAFLGGHGIKWLIATILTTVKLIICLNKSRIYSDK